MKSQIHFELRLKTSDTVVNAKISAKLPFVLSVLPPARDRTQLCIVETPTDLTTFESTGTYRGLYFVLMGRISPLNGIGPKDLGVTELIETLTENPIQEIILATNMTLEGDATA